MDELTEICRENNLFLIEDCAEAFGTYYKGQHVGTFGDVATFSFFGNKTITTGEGGMVVSNNKMLREQAYHLKTQGVSPTREYWHDVPAYNYRMTNICAAIGTAQLEQADTILRKKRDIASCYRENLCNLPVTMPDELPDAVHSFWLCSIVVDDVEKRQALREHLSKAQIETRPFFYPCHTLPHLASGEYFPVAELLSAQGISLPSFPDLAQLQVQHICDEIRGFFATG
jgi:perosamine synthetase